jgi:hypothetical protein
VVPIRKAQRGPVSTNEKGPGDARLMSIEGSLGGSEDYFDRILIGVMILLAIAVVHLFGAS